MSTKILGFFRVSQPPDFFWNFLSLYDLAHPFNKGTVDLRASYHPLLTDEVSCALATDNGVGISRLTRFRPAPIPHG
jgi:hypothetical protein